jgi:hypothetical protein
MGYSNQNSPGAIALDIETVPLDGAAEYVPGPEPVPEPDLGMIQAAKNLKNPELIKEDLGKRLAEAVRSHHDKVEKAKAAHAEKLSRAALDFNLARIVAVSFGSGGAMTTLVCPDEAEEEFVLRQFWHLTEDTTLVGFRIRTFDAPMLLARSRYLGVKHPALDLGKYGRGGRIVDLWDVLTFGLSDYETTSVMPRRLKSYAKRYGLTVDDAVDGKEIPALVQAGDWDAVRSHIESDVRLTVALAQRLGVMRVAAAV